MLSKYVKILLLVGITALGSSGCSALSSVAIGVCELQDVPNLPSTTTLDGETVVILKEEDMANLLIYFDSTERCIKQLK